MEPISLNLRHPEPSDLLNGEGWFASVAHNPSRLEWVWDAAFLGDDTIIEVDPGYQYWLPASTPSLPTMPPDHSETRASGMYDAPPSVLKALDRLAEYAAANPNHDTDSIVREARSAIRLQSIEAEDFEKWVDSLWEQFDWVFGEWAKECRPAECRAEKWKCPGDMQRLDHVQFREAARTILSRFHYNNRPLKGVNKGTLWEVLDCAWENSIAPSGDPDDWQTHHGYEAIILALRDWLVPEEDLDLRPPTDGGLISGVEWCVGKERQRLRAQLTAEANRVQHLNPGAK